MSVFQRLKLSFARMAKSVVVAGTAVLGLAVASVSGFVGGVAHATATPIAAVTTAIDFTDLTTDLTALMTALLGLFLVVIAFKLGISWLRKLR